VVIWSMLLQKTDDSQVFFSGFCACFACHPGVFTLVKVNGLVLFFNLLQ